MIRNIQKKFSDNARIKRSKLFVNKISPKKTDTILDLGGGNGKHFNQILAKTEFKSITISDICKKDLTFAEDNFGYKTKQLTESRELPFKNNEFDIVFCNSVIEHVTIPKKDIWTTKSGKIFKNKSFENQQYFANEIKRIGKSYFVQTPNKYFIIESHSWLPMCIVIIPRFLQIFTIKVFNKFWVKKTTPDWNLLTFKQMQQLFPDAEIYREKSLGMTKSFIAIKK